LYSITTISARTTVYNSVLLNQNGIIQQVKTTFLSSRSSLKSIEKYITLYTFSNCMNEQFTGGYVPYRFDIDDAEPNDEHHAALQDVILAGSDFIHPQKRVLNPCYAELVVVFANNDACLADDLKKIIRGLLNYYNKKCNWPDWKPFAWRKINTRDQVIVAISLEKYSGNV
jgi:hypothetical protein